MNERVGGSPGVDVHAQVEEKGIYATHMNVVLNTLLNNNGTAAVADGATTRNDIITSIITGCEYIYVHTWVLDWVDRHRAYNEENATPCRAAVFTLRDRGGTTNYLWPKSGHGPRVDWMSTTQPLSYRLQLPTHRNSIGIPSDPTEIVWFSGVRYAESSRPFYVAYISNSPITER